MRLKLSSGTTGFHNDKNEWVVTGSQMGRKNELPENPVWPIKLSIQKLPMHSSGIYDKWGAYWGRGATLWCATNHLDVFVFVRENDREKAKEKICRLLPNVSFYR